jgi:lipopolysaccharide heptosyltransferase III
MENKIVYKADCRFFKGYIPCKQHKVHGVHCDDCQYYEKTEHKILLIKLGAIGDVIRTTVLLHRMWKEFPNAQIWWLTYSPQVVPDRVDRVFTFRPEDLLTIEETEFSHAYNLDKDPYACALMNRVKADNRYGYELKDGMPAPINELSEHKFITGLFDDVNQANTRNYPDEIYENCGWDYNGEDYILDYDSSIKWELPNNGKKIIGLNTGCGERWVSRLWKNENWIELIDHLTKAGYFPMLLGGKQEDENNKLLAEKTGCYYPGHFTLQEFISLVGECDLVVTGVTMAMHITIGLKKQMVLINNIFNAHEFELYGRGEIVQPEKECHCFFSPKCKHDEYNCMDHLRPQTIMDAVKRNLK